MRPQLRFLAGPRGIDPWPAGASVLVVVALIAGLADTLLSDPGRQAAILAIGVVGLVFAARDNWLAPVAAALLVAAEVRDQAPVGTWAVAGGLLLLFALRRPRLDAVAAGMLFAGTGVVADVPWSSLTVDGGAFSLIALAAAAVGVGQWVQAQRRYVVAEVGRRREEAERRREEVTRHVAEERLRIARDLHDSVAHHFAVVSVQTNLARAQLRTSPPAADTALRNVQTAARTALQELQVLLGVLRDEPAAAVPAGQVGDLVASYRRTGLEVESTGLEVFSSLPADARPGVYRVLQEALTNAHRHGDGHATVEFRTVGEGQVELTVGNGIGPSTVDPAPSGGRGLIGMEERVSSLGGTVRAEQRDGGFVVTVRVPATGGDGS